jgi:hypothetical protein
MTLIMEENACLLCSEYIYHITIISVVLFKNISYFNAYAALYRGKLYLFFSISQFRFYIITLRTLITIT